MSENNNHIKDYNIEELSIRLTFIFSIISLGIFLTYWRHVLGILIGPSDPSNQYFMQGVFFGLVILIGIPVTILTLPVSLYFAIYNPKFKLIKTDLVFLFGIYVIEIILSYFQLYSPIYSLPVIEILIRGIVLTLIYWGIFNLKNNTTNNIDRKILIIIFWLIYPAILFFSGIIGILLGMN